MDEQTSELIAANKTKDRLFSIVAHDMNNISGGLSGLSELLVDSLQNGEHQEVEEYAGHIKESSFQLSSMLGNLLEWARSQTGRIEYRPTYFPIADRVNEVIGQESVMATNKQIELISRVDEEQNVYADPDLVSVVLRNLVHNAIKFTPKGGSVTVDTRVADGFLEIDVADTGIGIDEETQRKLLDSAYLISTRGTEREQGTGLGITLCKEFVAKNGGMIEIESVKGEGSTFRFTLPLEPLESLEPVDAW